MHRINISKDQKLDLISVNWFQGPLNYLHYLHSESEVSAQFLNQGSGGYNVRFLFTHSVCTTVQRSLYMDLTWELYISLYIYDIYCLSKKP